MKKHPEIFDEWLIIRCQNGDQKAFTLLVKRWHPKLLKQAYWYTRNREASKDVAQECWSSIVKGIKKIHDPASFRVWIYRIVHRRAVDWIREKQKSRTLEEIQQKIPPDVEVNINVTNEDLITRLRMHMRQLSDSQRIILSMFYMENYTIREIGQVLSIPAGTVKSRLYHAREQLKKHLKKMNYEKEL